MGVRLSFPFDQRGLYRAYSMLFARARLTLYVAPTINLYVFAFFSSSLLAIFPFHPV